MAAISSGVSLYVLTGAGTGSSASTRGPTATLRLPLYPNIFLASPLLHLLSLRLAAGAGVDREARAPFREVEAGLALFRDGGDGEWVSHAIPPRLPFR